tara:strand:+ start:267 stop:644 length:378 start_codon:yes stop_codon:yes gene_type:complete
MSLNIKGTDRTPEVILTFDPLFLKISGESFPEDVAHFYGEIISTINALSTERSGSLSVEIELIYINSSSIKALYRIFEGLDNYRKKDNHVKITWKSSEDDDIMQELGDDFIDRFPELEIILEKND